MKLPETYPEDALERRLNRFTPGPANRYIAADLVMIGSALRYVCGGFRRPLPPGFSYVRNWASLPLFVAVPGDDRVRFHAEQRRLVAPRQHVLHVYAMLWAIDVVATARLRPHRCDGDRVRLRFGCLRRLDLDRANIETARVHGAVSRDFKRALRRAGDAVTLTLDGVSAIELTLREPVVVRSPTGRTRAVRRVFVSADEPAAFAAVLAA